MFLHTFEPKEEQPPNDKRLFDSCGTVDFNSAGDQSSFRKSGMKFKKGRQPSLKKEKSIEPKKRPKSGLNTTGKKAFAAKLSIGVDPLKSFTNADNLERNKSAENLKVHSGFLTQNHFQKRWDFQGKLTLQKERTIDQPLPLREVDSYSCSSVESNKKVIKTPMPTMYKT